MASWLPLCLARQPLTTLHARLIAGCRLAPGSVTCVSFAGDGHMLTGGEDGVVCIWRMHDWLCLHKLGGHKCVSAACRTVPWARCGIAIGHALCASLVAPLASPFSRAAVRGVAVHPSNRFALSVGDDKALRMWNLVKGRAAAGVKLPAAGTNVQWTPDATRYESCHSAAGTAALRRVAHMVGTPPLLVVACPTAQVRRQLCGQGSGVRHGFRLGASGVPPQCCGGTRSRQGTAGLTHGCAAASCTGGEHA